MPGRTCTAMKYRPIGLPLRSRPRRCSSIAASIASSLRPPSRPRPRRGAFAPDPCRPPCRRRTRAPPPERSAGAVGVGAAAAVRSASTRSSAARAAPLAALVGRRRRVSSSATGLTCRAGGWRRGDRHRVADLGPAHQRPLGGLDRRAAFAHRFGEFDVVVDLGPSISPRDLARDRRRCRRRRRRPRRSGRSTSSRAGPAVAELAATLRRRGSRPTPCGGVAWRGVGGFGGGGRRRSGRAEAVGVAETSVVGASVVAIESVLIGVVEAAGVPASASRCSMGWGFPSEERRMWALGARDHLPVATDLARRDVVPSRSPAHQRGDRSMVNARRMDIEPMTLRVERICELYPRAPRIAVRARRGRDAGQRSGQSGSGRVRGQRMRRMCTLCTRPNIAKYTMRPEPP